MDPNDTSPHGPGGVAIGQYREIDADVLITCLDCMQARTFDREKVIARLQARGIGGPDTGIRAVSSFLTEPCPRCGSWRFESAPAFKSRPPRP